MSDKMMDTQELSEIRRMIGETDPPKSTRPAQKPAEAKPAASDAGTFNLDDIIAEVSGVVDRTTAENARQKPLRQPPQRTSPIKQPQTRPQAPQPQTRPQAPQPQVRPQAAQSQGRPQAPQPQARAQAPQPQARPQAAPPQVTQQQPVRKQAPVRPAVIEDDAWEDEDEMPTRRELRKQKKALRRERERQEDLREEEIVIKDPAQALRSCAKRAKNLAMRSGFVAFFGVAAIYLTVAPGMGLPLPDVVNYATSTRISVLVLLLLQFASMFAGLDVVGLGFYNLCTGHPDRSSLVACAMLASLIHSVSIILFGDQWGAWQPYCAVSIVLLYAMMQEEKARLSGRYRAYKAATLSDKPLGVYCYRDNADHMRRSVKTRVSDVNEFLREVERPDLTDRFSQIYTPLVLAASVVFALIASIGRGQPTRFIWALSAILSLSAPLGVLCSFGIPYRNVSRRLLGEGAAIAGARQAYKLRGAREVVLQDVDLFPAGSITIEEVRSFGSYSKEKLLAYAAAITGGQGLEIGRVFADMLREQYGRPMRAKNIMHYESGGLSADVGADSVLIGTSAFLIKLGLRLRDVSGIENAVFVVINSQIAGEFSLVYHPTAQTYGALHLLRRLKLQPILAVQDFNISPAMVESLFELRRGTVDELSADRVGAMNEVDYSETGQVCAILSKDGLVPYAQAHAAADKLAGAVRSNLILGAFAGVCGVLLMFYLTFLYAVEAVEPRNVLLYLLLWYLPVFVISRHTKKNY